MTTTIPDNRRDSGADHERPSLGKKVRLGGSAAILGWLAWRTDWHQVADAFANLQLGLWLLAAGLYALTQIVSSVRWQLLSRPLGFERPLTQYISFYFIGMFFNLMLPTSVGGDVVRAWYLDGGSGRRLPAFLSVFVDRLSGLLVLLALACVAVVVCPMTLPAWLTASVWGSAAAAVLGLSALPLLRCYHVLRGKYERLGTDIPRALALVLRPSALILSLVIQAANVVLVWMIGVALGAPVPAAYYWILVPMVTLMTLVPVSLNGMGLREGGTVLLLQPLGVSQGMALSLAFLWFAAFTLTSLAGVGFYLFGRFPRFEVRPDDESVGGNSDQGRARQSQAAA